MNNTRNAVYPGSYDPITNGHIDIIKRGLRIFDNVTVAVLTNPAKQSLFTLEERLDMIHKCFADNPRIQVDSFKGLLVDYLDKKKIHTVVRGLRAISDFEVEFQMALMNRRINREVETIFLVPSVCYSFLSSRLVKEIYRLGGSIPQMVPELVDQRLKDKYHQ